MRFTKAPPIHKISPKPGTPVAYSEFLIGTPLSPRWLFLILVVGSNTLRSRPGPADINLRWPIEIVFNAAESSRFIRCPPQTIGNRRKLALVSPVPQKTANANGIHPRRSCSLARHAFLLVVLILWRLSCHLLLTDEFLAIHPLLAEVVP